MTKLIPNLHIPFKNESLIRKVEKPLSKRFKLIFWPSPEAMLSSHTIKEHDIAIVDEFWAQKNPGPLSERSTPLFVVLMASGPVAGNVSMAARAVELMEAGALECVTEDEKGEDWRGVLEFTAGTATDQFRREHPKATPAFFPKWQGIIIGFVVALGLSLLVRIGCKPSHPALDYFHAPLAHPSGIAINQNSVYICDWYTQSISSFKKGVDLEFTGHTKFEQFSPVAICWGEDGLWSLGNDSRIRFHLADPGWPVKDTYELGDINLVGLAWDGKNLWSCDSAARDLVRLAIGKSISVSARYKTEAQEPVGLVVKNGFSWILDGKKGEILKYQIQPGELMLVEKKLLQLFDNTDFNQAAGFGGDGSFLWVSAEKSGLLYRLKGDK